MNRANTIPKWYLANIATLDVVKIEPNRLEAESLARKGYTFTTKAVFQRFKNKLLTAASFREVEYPKNLGQFISANTNYTS
jgi:hypothetical protein